MPSQDVILRIVNIGICPVSIRTQSIPRLQHCIGSTRFCGACRVWMCACCVSGREICKRAEDSEKGDQVCSTAGARWP